MMKYTRRLGAPLIVAAALLGACRADSKKGPDSTALGADTTLNRDLALANRDTNAQPQLKDVPANAPAEQKATVPPRSATRPRSAQPAPSHVTPRTPAAPVPTTTTTTTASGNTATTTPGNAANPSAAGGGAVGTIAAGSTLSTHANSKICTNTNNVGDKVTATLDNAVTGSNGATIPAGATVHLTVTQLKRSENSRDEILMEFAVNSVTFGGKTYALDATVQSAAVDRVKDEPTSKDVQKVGVGAVAGGILGRILGKSTKATVIGAAAGAAVGAGTAVATANYNGCVNSGGAIVVKLNSPATVRV
ncbi:MAG TPA: hypothetical protein VGM50_18030 [Gemmatimonadaceae bacterium]